VSQESVPPSAAPKPRTALRTFATATPAKFVRVIVSVTFFLKNALMEPATLSVVVITEPRIVPTAIFATKIRVLLVVAMKTALL
jgi:hypothetical protein